MERTLENIPESYKHLGRISKIDKDAVEVVLESLSGCQSCQVKSACSIHDSGDKKVVIPRSKIEFEKGQRVNVILTKKQEANAVLLAYVYPFFVLMVSLFILLIFLSELYAGLVALIATGLYYLVLYFAKDRVDESMNIVVKKI